MASPLVIEHFDEVEQGHLRVAAALEVLTLLAFHSREEAFHHRVVVTIPAPAHAAGDAMIGEDGLVILARVRAALVRVMQQAGLRAATLERQLDNIALRLNTRPRMTLGYRTPADKLAKIVASMG